MSRPPRHSSILTPRGLEGCILFLKRLQDIDGNYFEKYDLEPSVFWHPVLILQTNEATSEATICNVSCLIRLVATSLAADLALDAVDYTQRLRRRRSFLLIRLPLLPRSMAKTPTNVRPASIEAPRGRHSSQARLH